MGIIAWIIIGIIAGWLAEQIMGRNHGLLTNLIVGVVGALIGGFIANALGIAWGGWIASELAWAKRYAASSPAWAASESGSTFRFSRASTPARSPRSIASFMPVIRA